VAYFKVLLNIPLERVKVNTQNILISYHIVVICLIFGWNTAGMQVLEH